MERPTGPSALFIDLDGTMLDPADRISPVVAGAVRRAAERIPVAIASGRVLEDVAHFARLLGLDGPQISDNGARLVRAVTGQTVRDVPLEVDCARRIIVQLKESGKRFFAVDSGRTVRDVADFIHWRVTVITGAMGSREEAETHAALGHGNGVAAISSMGSRGEWYINYTHSSVNKGRGVRMLCEGLGIDPSSVMAIGDGINDLEMFDAVGFPVAMGHAVDAALQKARFITGTLKEDGVAQAIERFVLAG